MMFHGMGQIGDDNSAGAAALANPSSLNLLPPMTLQSSPNADLSQCEWCATNPFLSMFTPACYSLNEAICSPVAVAYAKNSVPASPPSQDAINSQTPDATINDILTRTQQNAVDSATAAAAAQGSYLPPTPPPVDSVCTKGSDKYNAALCFLTENSGIVFTLGLVFAGFAFISPSKGRRR